MKSMPFLQADALATAALAAMAPVIAETATNIELQVAVVDRLTIRLGEIRRAAKHAQGQLNLAALHALATTGLDADIPAPLYTMIAYCWASGRIEFTSKNRAPKGALVIASHPGRHLKRVIYVEARHGHDKGVLLVPGVPEAKMLGRDPVKALIAFEKRVEACLSKVPTR